MTLDKAKCRMEKCSRPKKAAYNDILHPASLLAVDASYLKMRWGFSKPQSFFMSFGIFMPSGIFGRRLPISHPHPRRVLTTFGVIAAVRGTLKKMKLLWMAYASASWVQIPWCAISSDLAVFLSEAMTYWHARSH